MKSVDVEIIEKKTGKIAATISVNLSRQNYAARDQDYIEDAWQCAVEDEAVSPNQRADYRFQVVHAGKQ